MKIYRNTYSVEGGSNGGFSFHRSKRDARLAVKAYKTSSEPPHVIAEPMEVKPGKNGLLRFLNIYASHNDNG